MGVLGDDGRDRADGRCVCTLRGAKGVRGGLAVVRYHFFFTHALVHRKSCTLARLPTQPRYSNVLLQGLPTEKTVHASHLLETSPSPEHVSIQNVVF